MPSPGPRFPPRDPPEDVAAYISRAISTAPYRYQATILLHAPAAAAAERVPPSTGLVEAVDEHTCLLHVGGPSLEAFPVHVARIGFEFEILSPPELRERVRELAELFGRAASGGSRS
jgi:predicted DNA-binding transcriptional regulator YafY